MRDLRARGGDGRRWGRLVRILSSRAGLVLRGVGDGGGVSLPSPAPTGFFFSRPNLVFYSPTGSFYSPNGGEIPQPRPSAGVFRVAVMAA